MKIHIYTLGLVLFLLTVGCTDEFLEKSPYDKVDTETFFQTEEDALMAINAAYQPLQRPKLYNMRMWATDIIAGNSIVGANPSDANDGIETKNQSNFITLADNQGVDDLYKGPAPGILYCNLVLEKVPAIEMDEALKNRILGEAKFLRGLYHFILVRFFGDVPLVLEPRGLGDDLRPFRTPKAEVYEQIIKDLTEAAEVLPAKEAYAQNDRGRATKGAAYGMLAKVYLTLGRGAEDWEKVVTYTEEVEALGYALHDNYADNFSLTHENGKESLFEVQYNGSLNASFDDFFDDANQSSWTSNYMGPRGSDLVAGPNGWNLPTQEFVEAYEEDDLRKDVTILYEGCPKFDGKEYNPDWSMTGYNVRKFLVPVSQQANYYSGSKNFPVLRFADVLLMKAEALNELGKTSEAEIPLNAVRHRAGLDDLDGIGQQQFREAVYHERRMELAFEGHRWFDLIRIGDGQYALDFLHSIGRLNAQKKHLLFPIPQAEIDRNPNLEQNTGY